MPDDSRGRKALDDLLGQLDLAQRLVRFTELRQGIGGGSERVLAQLARCGPVALGEVEHARGAVGHFVQPLALGKKPVLERRLLDGEPLQQIAPIESGRVRKRQQGALRHVPLELDDVDCYGAGIERHRIAVGMRGSPSARSGSSATRRASDGGSSAPWSPPCCPEQACQLVSGLGGRAASPRRPRVLAPSVWERQGERRDRGGLESHLQ